MFVLCLKGVLLLSIRYIRDINFIAMMKLGWDFINSQNQEIGFINHHMYSSICAGIKEILYVIKSIAND